MGSTLVIHAGGWAATREDCAAIEIPKATATYAPVPHVALLDVFHGALRAGGITPTVERLALARDGKQMFAVVDSTHEIAPGVFASFGLRQSYDQSIAVEAVAGDRVFVCDNMSMYGNWIRETRKHTPGVWKDLPERFARVVNKILHGTALRAAEIELMRGTEIDRAQAHDLICAALRKGAFPARDVHEVFRLWDGRYEDTDAQEDVPELRDTPYSVWRLHNVVTRVAKRWSPATQTQRLPVWSEITREAVKAPALAN